MSSNRRETILAIVSVASGLAAVVVLLGTTQLPRIIRQALLGTLPLVAGALVLLYLRKRKRR